MEPVTESDLRAAFVNCSKGEAQRAYIPRDLAERRWADLDFLGWRDPGTLDRSYLAAEHDGRLVAVALRIAQQQRKFLARGMCSLCLTVHPGNGVSLMTGRRTGKAGRNGDSVGLYLCTDLHCSLYIRGIRKPNTGGRMDETLTVDEQVERLTGKLTAFLDRLTDRTAERAAGVAE
ncbi:FBP domain-containing protein [Dactylosporangium vinaceum]|uniref:FBP domain-containing protein n=1 Tax=Dactylosporangium vinaceum TaxID=53362 RepID=A0ABV5M458_9ACTN|nr:FBP domain-containing protein [Dactylosporangium vinaceum]UAB93459.1 FBP domain-containing protein [Dactylosporangium vinaceum]